MDFGKFLNDAFNFGGEEDNDANKKVVAGTNSTSTGLIQGDYMTEDEEEYGYLGCSNIFKIPGEKKRVSYRSIQ